MYIYNPELNSALFNVVYLVFLSDKNFKISGTGTPITSVWYNNVFDAFLIIFYYKY
jgi:hypothetical protein